MAQDIRKISSSEESKIVRKNHKFLMRLIGRKPKSRNAAILFDRDGGITFLGSAEIMPHEIQICKDLEYSNPHYMFAITSEYELVGSIRIRNIDPEPWYNAFLFYNYVELNILEVL